jgi:A/G-specific adenine glycosylase
VKPHLVVTAAVTVEGSRVLIARRPQGGRHPGRWEFPGGKAEAGEGLRDCLRREMREELALEVEVGEHLVAVEHDYGDISLSLHAFLCRSLSGDPRAGEWSWVGLSQLNKFDLLPPDRRIAAVLKSRRQTQ